MSDLWIDDFPKRFGRVKVWIDALRAIIGWFGWQQLVIGTLLTAVGWAYGYFRGEPLVTLSMSAVSLFVALAYLFKLPIIARLMSAKPNVGIWRHVDTLALWQAACLFADINPPAQMSGWLPNDDAAAYYSALAVAAKDGKLERVKLQGDNMPDGVNFGTLVTRSSLQTFASERGFKPRFLQ